MRSSLGLVARISGQSEEKLELMYKKACADTVPHAFGEDQAEEEAEDEAADSKDDPNADNECMQFLNTLKNESEILQRDDIFADDGSSSKPDQELRHDEQLFGAPGGDDLKELFNPQPEPDERMEAGKLPRTLLEAIESRGELFNALWRYTLYLRQGPGGVDKPFLPNGKSMRRASRKLNWYQFLGLKINL